MAKRPFGNLVVPVQNFLVGQYLMSNSQLLKKYKEQPARLSSQDKDKLIMEYAPLIKFIAQKIAVRLPSNIELDDLISSGVIGLMDAIDKYDPTKSTLFIWMFRISCQLAADKMGSKNIYLIKII